MISVKNLSKRYTVNRQVVTALSNVHLDIHNKEIFAIIGGSGAGKSTLLRCINLLEAPTQGKVIIDGVDLTNLSIDKLRAERKKIAMIFQHFNLINNKTVFDNVALPLRLNNDFKENKDNQLLLSNFQLEQEIQKSVQGAMDPNHVSPEEYEQKQMQNEAIQRDIARDMQQQNREDNTGGYQAGYDSGFMEGSGGGRDMGSS